MLSRKNIKSDEVAEAAHSTLPGIQSTIYSMLSEGEENAIHSTEIAKTVNIEDRAIRRYISSMRKKGYVILSSKEGYYLPSTISEVKAYRVKEERRAKSIYKGLESARVLEKKLLNRQ